MVTVFEEHFERLAEAARERFEREGEHDHLIYLISFSGDKSEVQEVPFGALIHGMPGGDIHSKKERAYKTVASMMRQRGLPGYIEVMEMWVTSFKGSNEEVLDKYNQAISRYGTLKNVPGRDEMLLVSGRYGKESKSQSWQIGRRGNEVWLEHGLDGVVFGGTGLGKSAVLDRTSLALIKE